MSNKIHIIPLDDMFPHEESEYCDCKVTIEGDVVIHRAWDKRDLIEEANECLTNYQICPKTDKVCKHGCNGLCKESC